MLYNLGKKLQWSQNRIWKSFNFSCGHWTNLSCYKALTCIARNISDKKCTCWLEQQHDCLEEWICFASTWFLYSWLFIASRLMSSQRTILKVIWGPKSVFKKIQVWYTSNDIIVFVRAVFNDIVLLPQNIPADKQRLIFKGKVLQDDKKLSEYGMMLLFYMYNLIFFWSQTWHFQHNFLFLYRKIPKISPRACIFQRPFLRG